jgi:hypothetical protein
MNQIRSLLFCENTGFKRERLFFAVGSPVLTDNVLQRDYIFYFGYVQLTAVEENDPMGLGDAEHLAEVNGKFHRSILSNFLILNGA